MLKILSNVSYISARILANELKKLGEECLSVRNPIRIDKDDFVIRYGSTAIHSGTNTLNSIEMIRVCSNKLVFSKVMQENDIYSPVFYTGFPEKYPIIVRTTLNSFGGKGMIFVGNKDTFNYPDAYWTPYIETDFELRVHVLGGEIVKIFRKEGGDSYIRTLNYGWHFSLKDIKLYPKVISVVKKIFSIPMFATSFMALDLGWDSKRKEYVVFEGNSAPGLNEYTATLYAKYILDKINSTYR